jgi:hypothetical protein
MFSVFRAKKFFVHDVQLWQSSYSALRFVDQQQFRKMHALELSAFQTVCMRNMEAVKTQLLTVWFPEAQKIFYNASKKGLVPKMRHQVGIPLSNIPVLRS